MSLQTNFSMPCLLAGLLIKTRVRFHLPLFFERFRSGLTGKQIVIKESKMAKQPVLLFSPAKTETDPFSEERKFSRVQLEFPRMQRLHAKYCRKVNYVLRKDSFTDYQNRARLKPMMVEIISYFHNYICVWIYENRVEDFAPCFWKIGQILYINMAMSHREHCLPRVLLKEAITCQYKPLKSLQMSQTSETKLNSRLN